MRIQDTYLTAVAAASRIRKRRGTDGTYEVDSVGAAGDRVELSTRSQDVQKARQAALAAPEVREDLVSALLTQIADGQYAVVGAEVADRMIREHLALSWR